MEKNIDQVIWQYLDGQLTKPECDKFAELLHANEEIAMQVKLAKSIHLTLHDFEINSAPAMLNAYVLKKIKGHQISSIEGISLTPLLIFLASIVALMIVSLFIATPNNTLLTNILDQYIYSNISDIEISLPFSESLVGYIILGIIIFPLFYLIDKVIQNRSIRGFHFVAV